MAPQTRTDSLVAHILRCECSDAPGRQPAVSVRPCHPGHTEVSGIVGLCYPGAGGILVRREWNTGSRGERNEAASSRPQSVSCRAAGRTKNTDEDARVSAGPWHCGASVWVRSRTSHLRAAGSLDCERHRRGHNQLWRAASTGARCGSPHPQERVVDFYRMRCGRDGTNLWKSTRKLWKPRKVP